MTWTGFLIACACVRERPPQAEATKLAAEVVRILRRVSMAPPLPSRGTSLAQPFLRKIRDRLRLDEIALVAILIDAVGIERRQARIADHLPGRLVAVAAVDRIGEEPLHHQSEQRIEEFAGVEIELGFAGFERLERVLALLRAEPMEILAMRLAHPVVGRRDADTDELARRQWQLIAVLGLAFAERAGTIELGARAEAAGELPIDEDDHAAVGAGRRQLIGRNHGVGDSGEEGSLKRAQREIGHGLVRRRGCGHRSGSLSLALRREPGSNCRAGNAGSEQELAAWNGVICHGDLPVIARAVVAAVLRD